MSPHETYLWARFPEIAWVLDSMGPKQRRQRKRKS